MYLNYPKEEVSAFKVKGCTIHSLFLHSRKSFPWSTAFFEHRVSCDLCFWMETVGLPLGGLPFQFLFSSSSPPLFLGFNCWGLNPRSHVKWGLPLSYNLAKALHLLSGCGYWDWPPWHDLTPAQALWILVSQDRQFSSSSLPFGSFSESRTLVLISPVLSLEWHLLEIVNATCSVYSFTSLVSCCPWDKAQIP